MATSRFLSTPLWSAIPHGLPNLHHPRIQQLEAAAARCHPATAPLPPRHRPLPPAAARCRPPPPHRRATTFANWVFRLRETSLWIKK